MYIFCKNRQTMYMFFDTQMTNWAWGLLFEVSVVLTLSLTIHFYDIHVDE